MQGTDRSLHKRYPPSKFPVEERFWFGVDRRGFDECWPWLRGMTNNGYGTFWVKAGELGLERNEKVLAHRVAFRLIQGRWPDSHGLHGCDNRVCCNALNPAHLHEGTMAENTQEMFARNRQGLQVRSGETHARAKFTNEQVRHIRARYEAGGIEFTQLAAEFGVTRTCISFIVRRKRYGEVV